MRAHTAGRSATRDADLVVDDVGPHRLGEHGLSIERIVHLNTQRNARHSAGPTAVVAQGTLADLNSIDLDRPACHPPP
jgi:hypothetical protein